MLHRSYSLLLHGQLSMDLSTIHLTLKNQLLSSSFLVLLNLQRAHQKKDPEHNTSLTTCELAEIKVHTTCKGTMVQIKILQTKPRDIQQVRYAILIFVPRLMPVTSTRNDDCRLQTLPMDIKSRNIDMGSGFGHTSYHPHFFTRCVPVCS